MGTVDRRVDTTVSWLACTHTHIYSECHRVLGLCVSLFSAHTVPPSVILVCVLSSPILISDLNYISLLNSAHHQPRPAAAASPSYDIITRHFFTGQLISSPFGVVGGFFARMANCAPRTRAPSSSPLFAWFAPARE